MTILPFKHRFFVTLLMASCLVFALTGSKAFAGGATLDAGDIPVIQALAAQIVAFDKFLMAGGGSPDPSTPAEIDLHLGLMSAGGGGTPDPPSIPLNAALLDLRAKAVMLREHLKEAGGSGSPDPPNKFMLATARMIIERIDYLRRMP